MSTGGFEVHGDLVELARKLHEACDRVDSASTSNVLDSARSFIVQGEGCRDAAAYWLGTLGSCARRTTSVPVCQMIEMEIAAMKAAKQQKLS